MVWLCLGEGGLRGSCGDVWGEICGDVCGFVVGEYTAAGTGGVCDVVMMVGLVGIPDTFLGGADAAGLITVDFSGVSKNGDGEGDGEEDVEFERMCPFGVGVGIGIGSVLSVLVLFLLVGGESCGGAMSGGPISLGGAMSGSSVPSEGAVHRNGGGISFGIGGGQVGADGRGGGPIGTDGGGGVLGGVESKGGGVEGGAERRVLGGGVLGGAESGGRVMGAACCFVCLLDFGRLSAITSGDILWETIIWQKYDNDIESILPCGTWCIMCNISSKVLGVSSLLKIA